MRIPLPASRSMLMALLVALSVGPSAFAADDQKASEDEKASVAASTDQAAAEGAAYLDDPAFSRFVDLGLVQPAWYAEAASLLTDLALQLAEGERVLGRVHKAASAEDLARLAMRAAIRSGDATTLDRLAYFAEETGKADFLTELQSARKLGGASRGSGSSIQVPVDDLDPVQLAIYQEYAHRIDLAAMVNDRDVVTRLSKDAESMSDLPASLRDALVARAQQAMANDNQQAANENEAMQKLLHGSRPAGYQYTPQQQQQPQQQSYPSSSQSSQAPSYPSGSSSYQVISGYGDYSRMLRGTFVHRSNFQVPGYPPFPGVRIASLDWDSPLKRIGLDVGDVISRLDGVRIYDTGELDRHHGQTLVHYVRSGVDHAHKDWTDLGPYIGGGGGGGGGTIAP